MATIATYVNMLINNVNTAVNCTVAQLCALKPAEAPRLLRADDDVFLLQLL
jgi:hypothetical protein